MSKELPNGELSERDAGASAGRKTNGQEIRLKDPTGLTVILRVQTWERHVVVGHPELKDLLDVVTRTILEPEVVVESPSQPFTQLYYRLTGRSLFRRNDIYMTVVVRVNPESGSGTVKTAYLVKKIKEGGKLIWFKRA